MSETPHDHHPRHSHLHHGKNTLPDHSLEHRSLIGLADPRSAALTSFASVDRTRLEVFPEQPTNNAGINTAGTNNIGISAGINAATNDAGYTIKIPTQNRTDELYVTQNTPTQGPDMIILPETFLGKDLSRKAEIGKLKTDLWRNNENYSPILWPVGTGQLGHGLAGRNVYAGAQEQLLQERIRNETRRLYNVGLRAGDTKGRLEHTSFGEVELMMERVEEYKKV